MSRSGFSSRVTGCLVVACACGLVAGAAPATALAGPAVRRTVRTATQRRLRSFGTAAALRGYVQRLLAAQRADARRLVARDSRARRSAGGGYGSGTIGLGGMALGTGAPPPARSAAPSEVGSGRVTASAARPAAEPAATASITNTQEVGVDEGDIVKVHGDHLVVLRRGRLFTLALAGGPARPVSAVNAFPPDSNAEDAWYDEMLVDGDTVVVIGYSYETSSTELGLFDIDAAGIIRHRSTFYLRSNDYYSSRNYASRLLGHTLVLYMPYSLVAERSDDEGEHVRYLPSFPAMRRWQRRGRDDWHTIVMASQVFQPIQQTTQPVLHTVVTCDLAAPSLRCAARGIVGPGGRTFYVASDAVYVWVSGHDEDGWWEDEEDDTEPRPPPPGVVYRLPLDGSAPGAMRAFGAPTDQFSLRAAAGHLNALLVSEGNGDAMWAPESAGGGVALLRVPLSRLTTRVGMATREDYTVLPSVGRGRGSLQNRFVGDSHVLYGLGAGWRARTARQEPVYVHRYGAGSATTTLQLPHGVDRIEPMGSAAVVVGSDGSDLHFSAIELGATPHVAGAYVQPAASQGEERSHGFFYLPTSETGGLLGLPVRGGGDPGWRHLRDVSASVLFLRVERLRFDALGSLGSRAPANVQDGCVASCIDWYGNARPIFLGDRVFALLGYELVEGRIGARDIREIARADMLEALPRPAR